MTNKKIFYFLLLVLSYSLGAWADEASWPQVLDQGTLIPKGSTLQVKPYVDPKKNTEVYSLNTDPKSDRVFNTKPAANYQQVTSIEIKEPMGPGEVEDLKTAAKSGELLVQTAALDQAAKCSTDGEVKNCNVQKPLNVQAQSPYEPNAFAAGMMAPSGAAPALPTQYFSDGGVSAPVVPAVAGQLPGSAEGVNSARGTGAGSASPASQQDCAPTGFGPSLAAFFSSLFGGGSGGNNAGSGLGWGKGGGPPMCAIRAAQAARQNAIKAGRKVSNFMIVNDYSAGLPGRMWFLNPQGQKVSVGSVPNPLVATGGKGGFGAGAGSEKTPNGAMITGPYHPPRGGNIKNGIELYGLEPGNQDIHSRGVLLHGADPNYYTRGCIGIPGRLQLANGANRVLGGADYFTELATGPLASGGAIIYNFTPSEKQQECR